MLTCKHLDNRCPAGSHTGVLHGVHSASNGCPSCSHSLVVLAVQRPHKVKVRAQDVKGSTVMLTLNGWQARIFQHEYDHLQVREQYHMPSAPLLILLSARFAHSAEHTDFR